MAANRIRRYFKRDDVDVELLDRQGGAEIQQEELVQIEEDEHIKGRLAVLDRDNELDDWDDIAATGQRRTLSEDGPAYMGMDDDDEDEDPMGLAGTASKVDVGVDLPQWKLAVEQRLVQAECFEIGVEPDIRGCRPDEEATDTTPAFTLPYSATLRFQIQEKHERWVPQGLVHRPHVPLSPLSSQSHPQRPKDGQGSAGVSGGGVLGVQRPPDLRPDAPHHRRQPPGRRQR